MSIVSLIRRAPKRFSAAVLMVAAAVIVPAAVFAWGPSRPTYTIEHPADHVTFNSITNNPVHGDERNFVLVKDAGAANSTYSDDKSLVPGKEYTVYVYYHNNAASNLNASGKGIAHDVVMRTEIPALVKAKTNDTKAVGYINASNATPKSVWDHVNFDNTTDGDIALRIVPGSATIHNFGKTNGKTLSDSIVTTGVKLGYDDLNGDLKGCNQFAGYVTFNLKAEQANFTVSKQVRLHGDSTWKESVDAKGGDIVDYLISYKNTGTTRQNNVVLKDTLPTGITYVNGSTKLANSSNPSGMSVNDNLTTTGINIGNYEAGANAFVMFSAKVKDNAATKCGPNTLRNVARVETNNGAKQDTADVKVTKECAPEVKYTCDALAITRISRTEFTFKTTYTVENATFKKVTYVIRDSKGNEVDRKDSADGNLNYVQTKVGKYTVQAIVTVTVDGQDKTVTDGDCEKEFEVPKTPEYCPIPGKEYLPKDSKDCKEVPELPHTGMTENIVAILGLGALIASIAYFVASRRALNQ